MRLASHNGQRLKNNTTILAQFQQAQRPQREQNVTQNIAMNLPKIIAL